MGGGGLGSVYVGIGSVRGAWRVPPTGGCRTRLSAFGMGKPRTRVRVCFAKRCRLPAGWGARPLAQFCSCSFRVHSAFRAKCRKSGDDHDTWGSVSHGCLCESCTNTSNSRVSDTCGTECPTKNRCAAHARCAKSCCDPSPGVAKRSTSWKCFGTLRRVWRSVGR